MLKVALLATALLATGSTAAVEGAAPEFAATPVDAAPCHPEPTPALACVTRAADADVDGDGDGGAAIWAAGLASHAGPGTPTADWTSPHATQDTGLDLADAQTRPGSLRPPASGHDAPQPLIPPLLAVGALMVLLRRRPA